MAAWLTVYCSKSVDHVTADDLFARLNTLDLYTIAEGFGIEDEEKVVNHALAHLRIEPVSRQKGVKFAIRYKPGNARPMLFHLWAPPTRVQTERDEALEQFEDMNGRNIARIRRHLAKCVEVVALELGWTQAEDMGVVIAGQIVELLAVEGDGLIRDQNDDWWAVKKNGVPVFLVG